MIKAGNEPSIYKLADVCDRNNISLAYVLSGIDVSDETLELIALLDKKPEERAAALAPLSDPPKPLE